MKKFISLTMLIVILISSLSYAEPVITPMRKGQAAPYTGVLFSPEAAAGVITEISSTPEKIRIETEAAVKTAEAKKDFKINELTSQCRTDKEVLQADIDSLKRKNELLLSDIEKLQKDAPNKPLIFGAGVVGGIALTLATVFAVSYMVK